MRLAVVAGAIAVVVGLAQAPLAQQRPPRDGPPVPLVGTASIAGTVTSGGADATPLGLVQLMLLGTGSGYVKIAETDEHGRFTFAQLPADRYLLGATRAAYLDTSYGAKRPGRPGTAVNVAEGQQLAGLSITMIRGGVVTGRVTDDHGQPMPNAAVRLLPVETKAGERVIGGSNDAAVLNVLGGSAGRTDERGLYRIYGVSPGEYAVALVPPASLSNGDVHVLSPEEIQAGLQALRDPARGAGPPTVGPPPPFVTSRGPAIAAPAAPPPVPLPPAGPTINFAPVYYPGTTEVGDAASVVVSAGEESGGIDIRLHLVPTARIEGQIVVPGEPPPAGVVVTIRPAGGVTLGATLGLMQANARSSADGRFTLNGIAPGHYTLSARTQLPSGSGRGGPPPSADATPVGQSLWASTDIVVTGQNLSGLVLMMQPGLTLSGKVVFKSAGSAKPKDDLHVAVSVQPPQAESLFSSLGNGTMAELDRTFSINGLIPGRYVVAASVSPSAPSDLAQAFTWTVESVLIDGREVADVPVDLTPSIDLTNAVIVLSDRQQEVAGTLKESTGRPAPDYTVVLFSTDTQYWVPGSRRILTARPATDGRFDLSSPKGLPPGSYFLAAVTDLGADEQYDAALLTDLSKAAVKLTLAPGERKEQDLRIR